MAFTPITDGPPTPNFIIQYDRTQAFGHDMAEFIKNACENEFTVLSGWFGVTTGFGPGNNITVTVRNGFSGKAQNGGYKSDGSTYIYVNSDTGLDASNSNLIAPMELVTELVEIFMDYNNKQTQNPTWEPGDSDGEGLSQFCGILRYPQAHYLNHPSFANAWLSSNRMDNDFISKNDTTDGNSTSFGCVLLFLFYLQDQLGFTPQEIIQNGGSTLAATYQNLTNDTSDPFGFFLYLVNSAFEGTSTIPLGPPGPAWDDPFPLFTLQFWNDRMSFSKAEVTQNVTTTNHPFTNAVSLVLEGFSPSQWQARGSPIPATPTLAAPGFPEINFVGPQVVFQNNNFKLARAPMRIHFKYDITFGPDSPNGFTTQVQELAIDSSVTISSVSHSASAPLVFYGAEDPYFVTFSTTQDNERYLAEDLRTFSTTAQTNPVPGGPYFGNDSIQGARDYLAQLLTYLNQKYGDPGNKDPFDPVFKLLPDQQNALNNFSSVVPNTGVIGLDNGQTGIAFTMYNFAIARVRLNGDIGTSTKPVKVFFRVWQVNSPDTDYTESTQNSTYKSQPDALSYPNWPLADSGDDTFPFFATSNSPPFGSANDPEFGGNGGTGVNNQIITVLYDQGQWAYFGCLLNVYDSTNLVNGTPVTQLLPGTHHCLVAQIAYDDAPIVIPSGITISPGNGTDKLAQRNLQITPAYNPGLPPTNRVPQTFDVRPSDPSLSDFDELMIDWGTVPVDSIGNIFWPGTSASQVLKLAEQRYAFHDLGMSDANTITCPINGALTYVPIPPSAGANFAGLLTVELPLGVTKGQQFTILVRRYTTSTKPVVVPPKDPKNPGTIKTASTGSVGHSSKPSPIATTHQPIHHVDRATTAPDSWRTLVGTFQVNIPVKADSDVLPFDEETLSIFKWRLSVMSPTNRWYPVLQRYIRDISLRIDGHGGNASGIPPSATGLPIIPKSPCGKVKEIRYDCCGDFIGFLLGCGDGEHAIETRERGIERVVLRSMHEDMKLEVLKHHKGHIKGLVLRE
jgi:hypothetical protein